MILVAIGLILFFGIWSYNMVKGNLKKLDINIYNYLKIREPFITILKIITVFGSTKFFVVLSFLILLILKNKTLAILIVVLLIISSGLIESFKRIFKRERPNIRRLVYEKGYSFPSGHTTSSTSFLGFLIFLVVISPLNLQIKVVMIIGCLILMLLIGFSRIYLGVHYFSDVIAGYLLASSYVFLYVYFVHYLLKLI